MNNIDKLITLLLLKLKYRVRKCTHVASDGHYEFVSAGAIVALSVQSLGQGDVTSEGVHGEGVEARTGIHLEKKKRYLPSVSSFFHKAKQYSLNVTILYKKGRKHFDSKLHFRLLKI